MISAVSIRLAKTHPFPQGVPMVTPIGLQFSAVIYPSNRVYIFHPKRKMHRRLATNVPLTPVTIGVMMLVFFALWARTTAAGERARPKRIATDEAFMSKVVPLVENYCLDCHGEDDPEGGVSLDDLSSAERVLENRDAWAKAFRLLGIDGMPPRDYDPRPSREERMALVEWLDLRLYHVDCDLVDDPGRVTIRRLNRTEYNNTIRDLLGVDIRPADDFPSDDVGYGFNNIGDVLSLPPLLFEKYIDASEKIAKAAILTEPLSKRTQRFEGGQSIQGPMNVAAPEVHQRIVFTRPSDARTVGQAAGEIFRRLMPRAFRRPVDDVEVDRVVKLVEFATKRGDSFERGVQVGLQALLVSPHFLFRIEHDPDPDNAKAHHRISDYELASRLSYFLWSTMPDDELFRLAEEGKLHEANVLDGQIARMLKDPKADALVENFASQWLNVGNLVEVTPDSKMFPEFTPELRADMVRETQMFAETIFREDRSLLDFLDADFTFANQRLAKHYKIDGVRGNEFRRVSLPAGQRAGVLTHGSILTLTSNPNRTSLVRRGKWILDNVLGMELPEPPANVPSLEDGAKESGATSLREQLKIHRENPACSSCHDTLDPLGFGFENFDAIGRWREKSEGKPVEAGGTLPGGESFSGPVELVQILKKRKQDFAELVTKKMLTYALGRGLELPDSCTVDDIVADLQENDYRFTLLVSGIVHSRPFLMRRGDSGVEK